MGGPDVYKGVEPLYQAIGLRFDIAPNPAPLRQRNRNHATSVFRLYLNVRPEHAERVHVIQVHPHD